MARCDPAGILMGIPCSVVPHGGPPALRLGREGTASLLHPRGSAAYAVLPLFRAAGLSVKPTANYVYSQRYSLSLLRDYPCEPLYKDCEALSTVRIHLDDSLGVLRAAAQIVWPLLTSLLRPLIVVSSTVIHYDVLSWWPFLAAR